MESIPSCVDGRIWTRLAEKTDYMHDAIGEDEDVEPSSRLIESVGKEA
jgi:hypothetical protein